MMFFNGCVFVGLLIAICGLGMAILPWEPKDDDARSRDGDDASAGDARIPNVPSTSSPTSSTLSLSRLLTSAEKFRLIVENTQEGILILDTDGQVAYCNGLFAMMCGLSSEALIGRSFLKLVNYDDRDNIQHYLQEQVQGGQKAKQEIRFQCQEHITWALLSSTLLHNAEGKVVGILAFVDDISAQQRLETELRTANRTLHILWETDRALLQMKEEHPFLQTVCRILIETGGYRLAWIGWQVHDESSSIQPIAYAGYEEGYLEHLPLTWADTTWGQAPAGLAIRTGQPAVMRHVLSDPHFTLWHAEALQLGYASVLGLPIFIEGQLVGALNIYAREPDAFSDAEVQLLTKLAGDLALGVTSLRTQSERDLAELALRESEHHFRLIVETAQEGLWVTDSLARAQYLNQQMADLLGYPLEDILGRSLFDFVFPDDRQRAEDYFAHRRQRLKEKYDIRLVRHDGATIWAIMSASPILDETGTFTGSLGMLIDITERKAMEMEVEKERSFLFSALDLLPIPILFIDIEHGVFRSNRASETFFGDIVHGQHWGIQLLWADTHTPIPYDEWPIFRALRGESLPSSEWWLRFPDGREVPILLHHAPIYLDGKLSAAVIAFQDITALKETDAAKNQFLMVLSHELKTPLTNIIGWAQMGLSEADMMHDALESIARNADKQKCVLDELLIMARLLTGTVVVKAVSIDLWMLAMQCCDELRNTAKAEQLTWTFHPPAQERLPIIGDPLCLQQAIHQLLDNAIKFNTPHGSITIGGDCDNDQAMLTITDTGIGLTADQVSQLFHPFQQIQRDETRGGLGLGLTIAKGLIDLQRGRLWVNSAGPDQGCTFSIALPLHPPGEQST